MDIMRYNGRDKEYSLNLQAVAGWFHYPFTLSSWKASNGTELRLPRFYGSLHAK